MGVALQAQGSEHFLVVSSDTASAAATGQLLDQVYRRFYESFTQAGFSPKPASDKLICVSLNSYGELDSYGRLADGTEASWMDGFYSYRTNRIAFVRSGGGGRYSAGPRPSGTGRAAYSPAAAVGGGLNVRTVTHELSHQLAFNSGLQRRDLTNPFWLTEGLATNFEAGDVGSCGLGQAGSIYMARLSAAKAGGRLIPLRQFLGLTEMTSGGQATLDAYAQGWGLFRFLYQSHRKELREYMAGLASIWTLPQSSQSLVNRFIGVFGPIEPLERDFQRFIDQGR